MNWKFCYTIFCVQVLLSQDLQAEMLDVEEMEDHEDKPFIAHRYDLDMYTYILEKNSYFEGRVRIVMKCMVETRFIALNITYLNIHTEDVEVNALDDDEKFEYSLGIESRTAFQILKIFYIALHKRLLVGKKYEVVVKFSKPFKKNPTSEEYGYILQKYKMDSLDIPKWMTFIRLDNFDMSSVFPCFDEIDGKATFRIRSFHHKNFIGFSSGNHLSTESYDDMPGWVVDKFEETINLPPSSIAILLIDLKKLELTDTSSNVVVRVWADISIISEMGYLNKISLLCFQYFSNYFDITDKMKKLDVIIQPTDKEEYFAYYGVVSISQSQVVYSEKRRKSYNYYVSVLGLCRIISKQWIGHMVTLSNRRQLWLHHCLNLFLQRLCFLEIDPKFGEVIMLADYTISYTKLLQWHPEENMMDVWNFSFDIHTANRKFQKYFFWKGEILFRMLYFALGPKLFQDSLANYLNIFKFAHPNAKGIWDILTETAQKKEILPYSISIEKVVKSFLTQTRYPVIFAEYYSDSKVVSLRQQPYRHVEEEHEWDTYWIIPIRFITKTNPNFEEDTPSEWLDIPGPIKTDLSVDAGHWYLLNLRLNVLGYVHYDEENWALIQEQLLSDHISIDPTSRVRLVIDIFALAEAGILTYDFLLKTMKYLTREESYPTWIVALKGFKRIQMRLFGTPLLFSYEKYVRSILRPVCEEAEFKDMNQFYANDHVKHFFKVSIIEASYKFNLSSCRDNIRSFIKKIKKASKGSYFLPNSIIQLSMCDELQSSSSFKKCDDLLTSVRENTFSNRKEKIIKALTCCTDLEFVKGYLNFTFGITTMDDVFFGPKERLLVIRGLSRNLNEKIHRLLRQFFMDNYNHIEYNYGFKVLISFSMVLFEITTKKDDLDQVIFNIMSSS